MAVKLGELYYDIDARTVELKKAEKDVQRSTRRMGRSFAALGSIISVALAVDVTRRALVLADNMRVLDVRIKNATKSQKEFIRSQQRLLEISKINGQQLTDSVVLFERLSLASDSVGATN